MMQGVQMQVWQEGLKLFCRMVLPLRIGGTLTILATIDSRAVMHALQQRGISFRQKPDGSTAAAIRGVEVGSFLGNIGKFVKKVATKGVIGKALKLGKALVTSPLGKLVAPGAALAIKAAEGAAKLTAATKSKDPQRAKKAKLALAAAKAQAAAETKAGRQLPLPSGVQNRDALSRAAFRYLVTVDKMAA
jgi:hypothetical protein